MDDQILTKFTKEELELIVQKGILTPELKRFNPSAVSRIDPTGIPPSLLKKLVSLNLLRHKVDVLAISVVIAELYEQNAPEWYATKPRRLYQNAPMIRLQMKNNPSAFDPKYLVMDPYQAAKEILLEDVETHSKASHEWLQRCPLPKEFCKHSLDAIQEQHTTYYRVERDPQYTPEDRQ